jgi:translocation and assembly module TamA
MLASRAGFGYHAGMIPRPSLLLWLFAACSLMVSFSCHALDYSIRIDAPPALLPLLDQHLPLVTARNDPDLDRAALDEAVRTTPQAANKLLETEGYFSAETLVEVIDGPIPEIHVRVIPGTPVTVSAMNLHLTGAIETEPDYASWILRLQKQWPLAVGRVFRQADWDQGKDQVLRALQADRFPLAHIRESRVDIDPVSHMASVSLTMDSGPRISFGALTIRGLSRYSPRIVQKLADFQPGDPYSLARLMAFQRALQQSSQFSSALVSADPQKIVNRLVPVEVVLTEQPRQKLDLGLTYATDTGFGSRIGYEHYNLFNQGWTGSTLWQWDHSTQSLAFGLAMPREASGYVNTFSTLMKKTDVQGLMTESNQFAFWRTHAGEGDELRWGINYLIETEHVNGELPQSNRALLPTFGWTRREIDSRIRPRSGYLLDGTVSATPGQIYSSTPFTRAYGRSVGYWSPFPAWGTAMARLELGQVWAADRTQVPASQLFRAGGVNSVRGYAYQSLGLPGASDSVVGGSVLATASLEYQIPVLPDWALAVFVDAGNASLNWQSYRPYYSHGIGLRWFSPVAPFALDLAQARGRASIMLNMSLGLTF